MPGNLHVRNLDARRGLTEAKDTTSKKVAAKEVFLGFRPIPRRGVIVTNEIIDRVRID
jgi:hypothetical protein